MPGKQSPAEGEGRADIPCHWLSCAQSQGMGGHMSLNWTKSCLHMRTWSHFGPR